MPFIEKVHGGCRAKMRDVYDSTVLMPACSQLSVWCCMVSKLLWAAVHNGKLAAGAVMT